MQNPYYFFFLPPPALVFLLVCLALFSGVSCPKKKICQSADLHKNLKTDWQDPQPNVKGIKSEATNNKSMVRDIYHTLLVIKYDLSIVRRIDIIFKITQCKISGRTIIPEQIVKAIIYHSTKSL